MKSAASALWIGLWISAPICLAPTIQAQSATPKQEGATITCNERFVYVLHQGQLLQFDATTLELKQSRSVTRRPVEVVRHTKAKPTATRPRAKPSESTVENAVASGLRWLAEHQSDDGKWDADGFMNRETGTKSDGAGKAHHDVAVTGLAVLSLLGSGSTLRKGEYQQQLKKAVVWLRSQQDPASGLIGPNSSSDYIYGHSIATLALVEAYGLSDYEVLKPTAQRGINYLEHHRNPYAVWRYQPQDNDNDTSVTSWCLLAYLAAKDHGLQVNPNALNMVAAWYSQMTDPVTGRTGYTKRGGLPARSVGTHASRFPREHDETMTAMALNGSLMLGQDPKQALLQKQAARLLSKRPTWDVAGGKINAVGWYFGTNAMLGMGKGPWDLWSEAVAEALVTGQDKTGNTIGSWDPVGVWGEIGGRVYSTALHTLTLEAVNRYSKLIR